MVVVAAAAALAVAAAVADSGQRGQFQRRAVRVVQQVGQTVA